MPARRRRRKNSPRDFSIAARATPASSSAAVSRPTICDTCGTAGCEAFRFRAAAHSGDMPIAGCAARSRCWRRRAAGDETRTAGAEHRLGPGARAIRRRRARIRSATRRRVAPFGTEVSRLSRSSSARYQLADPGHRVADHAQQRLRIPDQELRSASPKSASATDIFRYHGLAGASFAPRRRQPWRRSRRRPTTVPGRAGTFPRSVDGINPLRIRCRTCPAKCSRGCRTRPRSATSPRLRRAPMARRRPRTCRAGGRDPDPAARSSPVWCGRRAAILSPTYGEHARVAALAGHP